MKKIKVILDTNIYIFRFQENQNIYRHMYDKDKLKTPKVKTIINNLKTKENIEININKKIVEEIKWICKYKQFGNQNLYYDKKDILELCQNYPGENYIQEMINQIEIWDTHIKKQDDKIDKDDMLIYYIIQKHYDKNTIIITNNKRDFTKCREIYKKENKNSKEIKILNIHEALEYFKDHFV